MYSHIYFNLILYQQVRLDHGAWEPCKLTGQKNPLYTATWQPELYAEGRHTLEVRAKDSSGSEKITEIEFALDKTISPYFPWRARIALMWDFTTMVSKILVLLNSNVSDKRFISSFRVNGYLGFQSFFVQCHSASCTYYRDELLVRVRIN